MTILTAKVAGVRHIISCTPPIAGKIPNATIAAMHLAGADEIHIIGGTQAIAAMALGTETVRKVDFIAGPGNAFVADAKRQLFGEVGIDLLAGPTEILIVADEHADPYTVAVDLLSQAEHGPDTPAILITNSEPVARKSMAMVDALLPNLPTNALAGASWRDYGEVAVVPDLDEAFVLADQYAMEHVQILTQNPRQALDKMKNYGKKRNLLLPWFPPPPVCNGGRSSSSGNTIITIKRKKPPPPQKTPPNPFLPNQAQSSSAKTPASPTATSASAPTTSCPPAKPPATPAASGWASTSAP